MAVISHFHHHPTNSLYLPSFSFLKKYRGNHLKSKLPKLISIPVHNYFFFKKNPRTPAQIRIWQFKKYFFFVSTPVKYHHHAYHRKEGEEKRAPMRSEGRKRDFGGGIGRARRRGRGDCGRGGGGEGRERANLEADTTSNGLELRVWDGTGRH